MGSSTWTARRAAPTTPRSAFLRRRLHSASAFTSRLSTEAGGGPILRAPRTSVRWLPAMDPRAPVAACAAVSCQCSHLYYLDRRSRSDRRTLPRLLAAVQERRADRYG